MKKLFRSILCMLLAVTALFAFASCKWNGKIREPRIKGDLMTEAEVEAWFADYEKKAESSAEVEGWYKFDVKYKANYAINEVSSEGLVRITGKLYASENADERMSSYECEEYTTETKNGEVEVAVESKIKEVFIDGVAYKEKTTVVDDSDGHSEETTYSKRDRESDVFIINPRELLDMENILSLVGSSIGKDVNCYEFRNGITIVVESENSKTVFIVELKKNSAEIKSVTIYIVDKSTLSTGDLTTRELLIELKETLTGSVKAPKDIEKYE